MSALCRSVGGVLTAPRVDLGNSFDAPQRITAKPASARARVENLELHLPPKSVMVVGFVH
jgi:alpha-L-arabinofuranosidase